MRETRYMLLLSERAMVCRDVWRVQSYSRLARREAPPLSLCRPYASRIVRCWDGGGLSWLWCCTPGVSRLQVRLVCPASCCSHTRCRYFPTGCSDGAGVEVLDTFSGRWKSLSRLRNKRRCRALFTRVNVTMTGPV